MIEENKQVNGKPKKNHSGLIACIMLIAGLLIGIGGSYYYLEMSNNTNTKVEKEEKKEEKQNKNIEINPDSLYMKELIEKYDHFNVTNVGLYSILYSKEKTNIKDIDESYLRALAVVDTNKNYIGPASFMESEFQEAVVKLFGNQVSLENKTFSIDGGCVEFNYQNGYYTATTKGCGGTDVRSLERKIIKAEKENQKLEVTVVIALFNNEEKKVYKSVSNGELSEEINGVSTDNFNLSENANKLNKYKYTFTYDDKNDGYYLNYIELVK